MGLPQPCSTECSHMAAQPAPLPLTQTQARVICKGKTEQERKQGGVGIRAVGQFLKAQQVDGSAERASAGM